MGEDQGGSLVHRACAHLERRCHPRAVADDPRLDAGEAQLRDLRGTRSRDIDAGGSRPPRRRSRDRAVDQLATAGGHGGCDSLQRLRRDRIHVDDQRRCGCRRGDRIGHRGGDRRRLGRRHHGEDDLAGLDDRHQVGEKPERRLGGEPPRPRAPPVYACHDVRSATGKSGGEAAPHRARADHADDRHEYPARQSSVPITLLFGVRTAAAYRVPTVVEMCCTLRKVQGNSNKGHCERCHTCRAQTAHVGHGREFGVNP